MPESRTGASRRPFCFSGMPIRGSEKGGSLRQCDPDADEERHPDRDPEDDPDDTELAARCGLGAGFRRVLLLQSPLARQLLIGHVVLFGHRPDQRVADQADEEQGRHDVERAVVDQGVFDATVQLVLADAGDDHRTRGCPPPTRR